MNLQRIEAFVFIYLLFVWGFSFRCLDRNEGRELDKIDPGNKPNRETHVTHWSEHWHLVAVISWSCSKDKIYVDPGKSQIIF